MLSKKTLQAASLTRLDAHRDSLPQHQIGAGAISALRQLQTLFVGDHEADPGNLRTTARVCSMLRWHPFRGDKAVSGSGKQLGRMVSAGAGLDMASTNAVVWLGSAMQGN